MKKIALILLISFIPLYGFSTTDRIYVGNTPKFLETTQCIIKYLPDGKSILAAYDYNVKHISLETGKTLRTWWTSYPIWDMTLAPDGQTFATATSSHSGNATGRITVWKLSSTKAQLQLRSNKNMGYIGRIAFSPDGKYIAGVGDPQMLMVWRLSSGETLSIEGITYGNVNCLTFHPQKNIAVIAHLNRELPKKTQLFPDTRAYYFDLDKMSMVKDYRLWTIPKKAGDGGISTSDMPKERPGYFDWEVYTLMDQWSDNWSGHSVSYSPKARFLLATGREVSVFNADTGEKLLTYTKGDSTHYYGAFHPVLKRVLVSSQHGFEWYDGSKGDLLSSYPVSKSPGFYPLLFDFSPDNKSFIHAEYERGEETTKIYARIEELKESGSAEKKLPPKMDEERNMSR